MSLRGAAYTYLRYSRNAIEAIAFCVLTVMVGISTLEITYRLIFVGGLNWVQELSLILAMWLYFMVYALIAKDREYIRIELFSRLLGPAGRHRLSIATRMLVLLFHTMLVWYAWKTTMYSRMFETSVLSWPEWVFYAPILVGCADIVLTESVYLVWQLRGIEAPRRAHEHLGVLL